NSQLFSSLSFFHRLRTNFKLPHLHFNLYPSTATRSYPRRNTKLLGRNMKLFRRTSKYEPSFSTKKVQKKKKQKEKKSHEDSYIKDKSTKKSSKRHLHMKMFLLLLCTFVQD
ncbi:hypothetical protein LINPERHAP1_LOCUS31501, partial [Linum perenne]